MEECGGEGGEGRTSYTWPCLEMRDRGEKQDCSSCFCFHFDLLTENKSQKARLLHFSPYLCSASTLSAFIYHFSTCQPDYTLNTYWYLACSLLLYLCCLKVEARDIFWTSGFFSLSPPRRQMVFYSAWAWRQEDTRRATKNAKNTRTP